MSRFGEAAPRQTVRQPQNRFARRIVWRVNRCPLPMKLLTPRPLLAAFLVLAAAAFTPAHAANSAIRPEPRKTLQTDPAWLKRHEGFVEIAKQGGVDVVFLGDSITDAWRRDGNAVVNAPISIRSVQSR